MESLVASEFAGAAEDVQEWVEWALSGDYWMRPLYYKTYVDADPEKNKKGLKLNIFCHPLIACGLGYHLGRTSSIPASIKSTKRPTGALIMAIQAAYRAVARWSSGLYVQPPRPYSDFSGDNWGDSEKRMPNVGSLTLPPYTIQGKTPTKDIERVVNKLSDKRWEDILSAAGEMAVVRGKKKGWSSEDGAADLDADAKAEEEETDFEIEDDADSAMDTTEGN
ncbi:hypothetical protein CPB84DRAFT_1799705 [Gymnopilus junonius]|uniref:Uncharacterized protein n=1 Tax=Gymnopilus junonius TaxID=109634 RepID=A0A9P5N992_GYMJU|nr:hypothetical protein CPB84DRAFT_1799705 [Gymnopilus junonius]